MIVTDLERRLWKLLEDSMALNRQYEQFALERQITHVQFSELRAMVTQIADVLGLAPLPPMHQKPVAPEAPVVAAASRITLAAPGPPPTPLATSKVNPLRGRANGQSYSPHMDQRILVALAKNQGPMAAVDITRAAVGHDAVTKSEVSSFWRVLKRLVRDGLVTKTRDRRYELPLEPAVFIPPVVATLVDEREEVPA